MGYAVLTILIALSVFVLYKSPFKTGLTFKQLIAGWTLKVAFIVAYTAVPNLYPNSKLHFDRSNFYNDSKVIAEYGKSDPVGYLGLLFGIGSNDKELLSNELSGTHIWSYADNGDIINDNRLILRINSVIHFFSFGKMYVHIYLMAFLAFLGLLALYKAFQEHVQNKLFFFFALCGIPTIAFWTSGLNKETILLLGLGVYFLYLTKWREGFNWKTLLGFLIGIGLLIFNKPHVGLLLIPLSIIFVVGRRFNYNPKVIWVWIGIFLLAGCLSLFAPPKANLAQRLSFKQTELMNVAHGGVFFINDSAFCAFDYKYRPNFQEDVHSYYNHIVNESGEDKIERGVERKIIVNKATEGEYKLFGQDDFHPFTIPADTTRYDLYLIQKPAGSYIHTTPINDSPKQLIMNAPMALINVLIRPFPTDPGSNLKHAAFTSNLLMIGLLVLSLIKRKEASNQQKYLIVILLMTALFLSLIIGWTTPVLGAVVRYKSAVDILLVIAAFISMKSLKSTK